MKQLFSRAPTLLFLALSGLAAPWPAQQASYSVELLPLPAGRKSFAAMNDSGVVGVSITVADGTAPFRYAGGVVERMPDPPGFAGPGRVRHVHEVDAAGNLIGRFNAITLGDRAVRWTAAGAELLQLPNDGVVAMVAVSPDGTVAISGWPYQYFAPAWEGEHGWGTGSGAEPVYAPFRDPMQTYLWRGGAIEPVPVALAAGAVDGSLRVDGINDAGQIALTQNVNLEPRAYLYDPRSGLRALPTLGAAISGSYAINAHGTVAGIVRLRTDRTRPVLWRDGRAHALPVLAGYQDVYATHLNDREVVLGSARADSGQMTAVVWLYGRAYDLEAFLPASSGWSLERPFAINAGGQILVLGKANGADELFLFTPIATIPGGHVR